ncbi:MAG: MurT ligase domain-containing protein [Candidatus Dormibacteria bacterium]
MMRDPRLAAAVLAGKATAASSRLLRRGGGTTLPGDVSRVLDPGVLGKLTRQLPLGSVMVTGTNGKTTVTGMIATALESSGRHVVSNASGANLIFGLTAAALADAGLDGRPRSEIGVWEVDELVLERAVAEVQPRLVVVTNFMRDQLDRSGELQTTASRVGRALRGLDRTARVVANVDDPHVWTQCESLPGVVAVGVESDEVVLPRLPHAADARACPHCEAALVFRRVVLSHCGTYHCPNGDFARPKPDLAITHLEAPSLDRLNLQLGDGLRLEVAVGGVYNAYNALLAAAALRILGLDDVGIHDGIASFRARFGRQEAIRLHDRELRFLLAKNPSGFDEVLRTADELGHCTAYLIALNDRIADGRDVSWIWDVDFERLATSPRRPQVVLTGRRAADLAVRLKYAGMPEERVVVEPDLRDALRRAAGTGDRSLPVAVLPTYTAMLELRAVAERAGAVEAFWADGTRRAS